MLTAYLLLPIVLSFFLYYKFIKVQECKNMCCEHSEEMPLGANCYTFLNFSMHSHRGRMGTSKEISLSNYDDFTASDIFSKDENGNIIYSKNDIHYIVNDNDKQAKLKDLEGYRYFLDDGIKPIALFLPVLFIGVPLTFLFKYLWFPNLDERGTPFLIGFPIFFFIKFLRDKKIKNILTGCETIENISNIKDIKEEKNIEVYIQNMKDSIPDFNKFHVVIFLLIASPFLMFAFYIIKALLSG